ncbi:hypothetical protein N0V88_006779 [Collariella sp. IMI 366227]|nr:hypothetical protein N0V88_006779 [Collariella sp. IMI 366227]
MADMPNSLKLTASSQNAVAPNARFYVDDLEDDWNYHQPFDFIYLRYMNGSIRDWPRLIRQAHQHLTPGGWLEMHDTVNPLVSDDGTLSKDSALYQWSQLLQEAALKFGSPLDVARLFKQQLIDAGFQNVVQFEYKWPVNPWPKDRKWKEIGMWAQRNLLDGLQGASLALFTKALGWSTVQLETFLVQVRKDIQNRKIHAYFPVIVVYGQKPE